MKPTPTPEQIAAFYKAHDEALELQPRENHQAVFAALSAALSVPAAEVVGEPVPSLETLQYYRDVHSDKFGWVKAPIRVVEGACGTIELLIAENAKFRKALTKIAERADDNLPMYTPGAMVHTAEEALGGKP